MTENVKERTESICADEIFKPLKGKHSKNRVIGNKGTTGKIVTDKETERKKKHARKASNQKGNKFYNVVTDKLNYLIEEANFTHSDLAYLWFIGRKVEYYDELHKKSVFTKLVKSNQDKTGLKNADIRKLLKLSDRGKNVIWQRFKNKCIANEVLKEDENGFFFMNRTFIFKGKLEGVNVVSTRISDTANFLEQLDPKDVGILISLQRFISRKNWCLVENPEEMDDSKIIYIKNVSHLERVSGINRKAFKRLWNMEVDGKAVITFFTNKGKQGFLMRPECFFRGDYAEMKEKYGWIDSIF